tara:strand:- start:542 stop:988 length:447 start_codon:yes stop_codon:yes gene_type:complete
MKLIELLDEVKVILDSVPKIKETTICTMEDMLIKVSEKKNMYMGAFVVYDQNNITVGEYSVTIPLSLFLVDKLRANMDNKIFIHSNTLSASIDSISLLRVRINELGYDGLNDCVLDVWTEQFTDALLAGTKLDFTIQTDLKGFCDILT